MLSRSFRWLESNVVSIFIALLLALVVWIIAIQQDDPIEQTEFEGSLPIEMVGLDPNLTITNEPEQETTIVLRAAQSTLRSLSSSDFVVHANLEDLGPGSHDVPLEVTIEAQALVISTEPPTVHVNLEQISERSMPVQLVTEGQLPNGYRYEAPILDPNMVMVSGPRSLVELVSEVQTSASIDGLRDDFTEQLDLVALDSEGNPVEDVTVSPSRVSVTVPIVKEEDFKEVAILVNGDFTPAPGYYISRAIPSPLVAPIRGEPDILADLNFIETAPIQLNNLTEDTTLTVQLQPPDGVVLEGIQTVEVLIDVEAQPGFKVLEEVEIQVAGLGEEFASEMAPNTVSIFLSGPLPILDRIGQDVEIIATIDLSELEPDTYQLQPEVRLVSSEISAEELDKVVIESVIPTVVDVEITEADGDAN